MKDARPLDADKGFQTSERCCKANGRRKQIRRHPFAPSISNQIRDLHVLNNWRGPVEVLGHWAWILLAIAMTQLAFEHASIIVAVLAYLIAAIQIGGRQRMLAEILHLGSHCAMAHNRTWNNFLSTACSGYWVLQSLTGYRHSHVRNHHGGFGDQERDPDYQHLISAGICGDGRTPANIWRHVKSLISFRSMASYCQHLWSNRIFPNHEHKAERVARLAFMACVMGTVWALDASGQFLLFWVIPLVTTQVWIGSLCELAEHYPMIDSDSDLDILLTRNRHCSQLSYKFFGLTQAESLHLVHHLFPRLPSWNTIRAHDALMLDPLYCEVNVARGHGWGAILLEIIVPVSMSSRPTR